MHQIPVAPAHRPTWTNVVLWAVPVLLLVLAFVPDPPAQMWRLHLELLQLAAVVAALFWLAPRRLAYRLGDTELEIRHLLGTIRLPYSGMQARKTAGRLGVRTFGTGLPGYLTGSFSFGSDGVHSVAAFASASLGGVLIGVPVVNTAPARSSFILPLKEPSGAESLRWYFLTPADPQGLLAELARRGVGVGQ